MRNIIREYIELTEEEKKDLSNGLIVLKNRTQENRVISRTTFWINCC